ncbi:MAG: DegT/DnrJ/EryC1/StrS family aminotransferase [Coriobacteriia bacterium]|nr:DegT/DnrJ/EryC1/StrS family aminotransferase [Coriobacteriia bacterium]
MIPVNEPLVGAAERAYVDECLRTGWISSAGRFIDEFEAAWAAYCGMEHGIAVTNGSAALELAVWALDLKLGDEIIMPTFTIVSCALAAVYNGAVPVLVDSEPDTWCMDVAQVEAKITPRTKAIMPVHIYGHPVDMGPVRELAAKYGLTVIEDAAEAHGATYRGERCGGLGDVSCFSFYANKIVTTGEGGMVLTNDDALANRLRSGRNLCFRDDRRFWHTEEGHNFRLTNVQAAIGLGQVERIDELVAAKRRVGARYTELLAGLPLRLPVERGWAQNVYWMYGVVLADEADMDATEFAARLAQRGVQTRPFFVGMHEQPVFLERGLFAGERYPVAEHLARYGLYLPSGLALTSEQQDEVVAAVREVLGV